jgi:hypothetical protein
MQTAILMRPGSPVKNPRMACENPEEKYVRELLDQRFHVVLRKLPEDTIKTADYELLDGTERVAVLEVKQLQSTPRTAKNGWEIVERDGVRHAEREDNVPRRVGDVIRAASKQLRGYVEPKILVFLNEERLADVLDLDEAYNGFLDYGDGLYGYTNTASARIADRILKAKKLIDLYVWINRHRASEPVFFRVTSHTGLALAQRFFGYSSPDRKAPSAST